MYYYITSPDPYQKIDTDIHKMSQINTCMTSNGTNYDGMTLLYVLYS